MADEAMEAIPGFGKRQYTLHHYLAFAEACQAKAVELTAAAAAESGGAGIKVEWNAELVGRALFCVAVSVRAVWWVPHCRLLSNAVQ
jgi:hypothetical protein